MSEQAALTWQPTLFGAAAPDVDPGFAACSRVQLPPDAWVDHTMGWLSGADELFARLVEEAPWRGRDVWMYERKVAQPRLTARLSARLPVILNMAELLCNRYGVEFTSVGLNLYRDGSDSVAWHGDRIAKEIPEPVVAIVSVGHPRKFLLRHPETGAAKSFLLRRSPDQHHFSPRARHPGLPSVSRGLKAAPVVRRQRPSR